MKTLFTHIPCFNEALTLPIALAALPRKVKGFHSVKWLVINDGSTDRTVELAQENGVDFIVHHVRNQGLA
jgi:glycosyltransferase involved in cell wall biosynthesis